MKQRHNRVHFAKTNNIIASKAKAITKNQSSDLIVLATLVSLLLLSLLLLLPLGS
jgi:hypothetical protein